MKPVDLSVLAGARFISSEMQEIFDSVLFLIPNWKWLALVGIFFVIYTLNISLQGILKKIKKDQSFFKDRSFMQFLLKIEIEKSVSRVIAALLGLVLVESLLLPVNFEKYTLLLLKLILAYNLIYMTYLAAEALGEMINAWTKHTKPGIDEQLVYMASKTLKVFVLIVGCLLVLQNFGVNVTALLAGLGLGGVALAFAAQDTVANVFGTITILLDTPFKVGDAIKVQDIEGVVEEIGFRSTRIRTLYNSLIILPNSVVAKEKIDNLTRRNGWFRFRHILGLTYKTTQEQIKYFCDSLQALLLADTSVDRERIVITFNSFGDSSLNVLVQFHYHVKELENENELVRSQYYLTIIHQLILKMNVEFAYPTRTLLVQNQPYLDL